MLNPSMVWMKTEIEIIRQQLGHGLEKLETELLLYADEADLWLKPEGIGNSAGNLCLHICGNLQHFIGAVLGKIGYERDRPAEFSRRNVARTEILDEIQRTRAAVYSALENLSDDVYGSTYPVEVFGHPTSTAYFLKHLCGHLQYHLGQINYHRRLLAKAG